MNKNQFDENLSSLKQNQEQIENEIKEAESPADEISSDELFHDTKLLSRNLLWEKWRGYSTKRFVRTFVCAFFLVSLFNMLFAIMENKDFKYGVLGAFQENGSFAGTCIFIFFTFAALTLAEQLWPQMRLCAHIMVVSWVALAYILMVNCETNIQNQMGLAVLLVSAIVLLYAVRKSCFSFIPSHFNGKIMWSAIAVVGVFFGFFVSAITVLRYLTYSSPNYDFGLFCNMFHNMKETGLPNITSERNTLLSHFAVHISPAYYLMLPFYMIFPSPVTLQILQAVVLYLGLIPLCALARHKGLSNKRTLLLAVAYAAYPALSTGCFYDLHENCFLTLFLLCTFLFFEKKQYGWMSLFAVLTLTIKEDAFIYLVFFAIYLIFSRKEWKVGLPVIAVSLAYFSLATWILTTYGEGVMEYRYGNLIFGEGGLFGVVKTFIMNPGYFLTQVFTSSSGGYDKVIYVLKLLLPLAFLPFATKKISRYILLAPILLNVITMYQYQPNINFQYSFGIIAFLFYASLLNLSDLPPFARRYTSQLSAVSAVLLFALLVVPSYTSYAKTYEENKERWYDKLDYALEEVLPADASVTCSTFLLAHIADRDEIYEVNYHKENGRLKADTEFYVFDLRWGYGSDIRSQVIYLEDRGYTEYYSESGVILILRNEAFADQ